MVLNGDLFKILSNLDQSPNFNIFDFDLMQSLPNTNTLIKWAQLIYNNSVSKTPIILNLVATIGRTITENEHIIRTQQFSEILQNHGMRVLGHSRFGYKDRQIPIRAERFVLKKRIRQGGESNEKEEQEANSSNEGNTNTKGSSRIP